MIKAPYYFAFKYKSFYPHARRRNAVRRGAASWNAVFFIQYSHFSGLNALFFIQSSHLRYIHTYVYHLNIKRKQYKY